MGKINKKKHPISRMSLIPEDFKNEICQKLLKYNVHRIKSLGYKGHYNYILKDEAVCRIIKEDKL